MYIYFYIYKKCLKKFLIDHQMDKELPLTYKKKQCMPFMCHCCSFSERLAVRCGDGTVWAQVTQRNHQPFTLGDSGGVRWVSLRKEQRKEIAKWRHVEREDVGSHGVILHLWEYTSYYSSCNNFFSSIILMHTCILLNDMQKMQKITKNSFNNNKKRLIQRSQSMQTKPKKLQL